jgi:hypothetical protein
MTSLEGCPHIVVAGSDLGVRVAADSRSCPVITLLVVYLMPWPSWTVDGR